MTRNLASSRKALRAIQRGLADDDPRLVQLFAAFTVRAQRTQTRARRGHRRRRSRLERARRARLSLGLPLDQGLPPPAPPGADH